MKPLLLFDIDHTLFDTENFSKFYRQKLIKFLDTTPEKFEKVRLKYHQSLKKNTDYIPEEYLKHLINSFHKDVSSKAYEKLHNLYYETENFSKNLFPDTIPSLKDLKTRHSLGIFSEGRPSFQKTKLVKSSLYDFFDSRHFYVFSRKTEISSIQQLPIGSTIIDDDATVIADILNHQLSTLNLIWLNRKNSDKHPHVKTVHTLTELI